MKSTPSPDAPAEGRPPTHAELAAKLPPPPPDDENESIQFAKKTFYVTAVGVVLFVAAAVVYALL